jgi:hypothetical protein
MEIAFFKKYGRKNIEALLPAYTYATMEVPFGLA